MGVGVSVVCFLFSTRLNCCLSPNLGILTYCAQFCDPNSEFMSGKSFFFQKGDLKFSLRKLIAGNT